MRLKYGASVLAAIMFCLLAGQGTWLNAQSSKRVMTGVRFDGNTAVISVVVEGGPADRAGIQVGDEIISAGEKFIVQSADLVETLKDKVAGDVVRLEIRRGDEFMFFDLKLIDAVKGDVVIGEDGTVKAAPVKLGILNELGPELTVDQWWGMSEGEIARLKENRGKVICLMLFQTDCRHSRRYGLPELKKIQEQFASDPDVLVLAIQTPFQSFELNTFGAAQELFEKMGLTGPMGHNGTADKKSVTFSNYKALGTPWFIVMDKQGIVRYNDSSLPLEEAIVLFEQLKAGKVPKPKAEQPELKVQEKPVPKPRQRPNDPG